jgi:hypothetical protein
MGGYLLDTNRINVFLAEVEDNASDTYEQAALAFGIGVYQKELQELSGTSQVDIRHLPEGLYFYAIAGTGTKPYTGKIAIQR